MAQNEENMSPLFHISGSIHHMIVIFGTHVENDDISRCFFFFFFFIILIFLVVRGSEMAKKWPEMSKNYVCLTLYLKGKKSPIITNFSMSSSIFQKLQIIAWRLLVNRFKKIYLLAFFFIVFFYFFHFRRY